MGIREDIRWKLKEGDCIFFLHLPKTAGTTVYRYILERFNSEEILIYPDESFHEHFSFTYPDDFIRYRFFRQHARYDFFRYLPRKPVCLTFLRNPITRILSLYNHVRRTAFHQWHTLFVGGDISIVEFAKNPAIKELSNFQVDYLASHSIGKPPVSGQDMLEIAKMRLHEFAYFGIQERFIESMKLLNYTFGWEETNYESFNVAPSPTYEQDLNSEELKAIRERNELDLKLYDYGLQLFSKRLELMEKDLRDNFEDGF